MSSEELVRAQAKALEQGDHGAVLAAFADNAVFHYPGRNPLAGDHAGKEAITGFLTRRASLLEGGSLEYDIDEHELVDPKTGDKLVLEIGTAVGRRNGRTMEWGFVGISRVVDGLVVDSRVYQEDDRTVDEFWS